MGLESLKSHPPSMHPLHNNAQFHLHQPHGQPPIILFLLLVPSFTRQPFSLSLSLSSPPSTASLKQRKFRKILNSPPRILFLPPLGRRLPCLVVPRALLRLRRRDVLHVVPLALLVLFFEELPAGLLLFGCVCGRGCGCVCGGLKFGIWGGWGGSRGGQEEEKRLVGRAGYLWEWLAWRERG